MIALLGVALAVPAAFQTQLDDYGLVLDAPADWEEVSASTNAHMSWEHGIRSPNGHLEVRYALRDMRGVFDDLEDCQDDPDCVGVTPDSSSLLPALAMATMANISGGSLVQPIAFPADAVVAEFGASVGYTAAAKVDRDWGGGYRHVLATVIHKEGVDAWAFFLFKRWRKAEDEFEQAFHSLRFEG